MGTMFLIFGIIWFIYQVLKEKFDEAGIYIFWIGLIIILALFGVR